MKDYLEMWKTYNNKLDVIMLFIREKKRELINQIKERE